MIKSSRSSLSDTEQLANLTRNIESGGDPALLQNTAAQVRLVNGYNQKFELELSVLPALSIEAAARAPRRRPINIRRESL
jgi:hypothetical protein